jgi:translocation and assembly module TamB
VVQIQGENWQAINIPEAEVRISPDLKIQADQTRTALNGEVVIPYARIRPRKIPKSAVSGSPDLIIVKDDEPPDKPLDPKVYSRVRIIFGDRVSFEGMGLRAKLSGNLLVIDEPGRPVTGSGRIGVSEGTYQAYGQDLKIERGYALFADSPVDNPGLDVRAVREAGEVTAGVRVSGTLKSPKLSVFSTPAMRETAALSYLLTGHGPGEGGEGDASLAAALKAAGAGSLASKIGRQVGLEELRVETASGLEQASVVAGTYLSPRLYVQYVNELASRENILRLRYDMTERLQIQTESGRSQGVDLFYTIER